MNGYMFEYGVMDLPEIKQDDESRSASVAAHQDHDLVPRDQKAFKQENDMMNWSNISCNASLTIKPSLIHSQAYTEQIGSTTSQEGAAQLVNLCPTLKNEHPQTITSFLSQVKREPASENDDYVHQSTENYSFNIAIKKEITEADSVNQYLEENETNQMTSDEDCEEPASGKNEDDCAQQSIEDYPFNMAIKREIIEVNTTDHYSEESETNQMTSEDEDCEAEMNEYKSALSDNADVKFENDKLPLNISNPNETEQANISADIAGEVGKHLHYERADNKRPIFQEQVEKLCYTNEMGHTCSACGKVFSKNQTYLLHIWKTHTDDNLNICELCGKSFKTRKVLRQHKAICLSSERPFACDMCEKTFKLKTHLKRHKETCHSNERPYSCDMCEKTFKSKIILEQHKTCHSNERPYPCDVCGKAFKRIEYLARHIAACHSVDKPHSCEVCGKAFNLNSLLNQHKAACHSNERPHTCDVCGKTFKLRGALNQHKATCHSDERPYSCDICGMTFKLRSVLNNHKAARHSNERPHSCDICGKAFNQMGNLVKHKAVCHSDERPHTCDICGMAFKRLDNLAQHKTACHLDERPYSCDVCGKAFKRSSALNQHKAACHSNERPHSCDICGKAFKQRSHLVVHQKVHTGEKPYACGICGKVFAHKQKARLHVQQAHENQNIHIMPNSDVCETVNEVFEQENTTVG